MSVFDLRVALSWNSSHDSLELRVIDLGRVVGRIEHDGKRVAGSASRSLRPFAREGSLCHNETERQHRWDSKLRRTFISKGLFSLKRPRTKTGLREGHNIGHEKNPIECTSDGR